MSNENINSSVLIKKSIENVWSALTNEQSLTTWYAPGSPWKIPNLKKGEKMVFILKPNPHNRLTEELPMELLIEEVIPYKEFSFSSASQNDVISFILEKQNDGTKISTNTPGYDESLANLKALLEHNKLPFT